MEKKIQLTVVLVFMAFVGMFFVSCYPSDTVYYSDLDLVATIYDKDKNFVELNTYDMPDSIVHLKDTLDMDNNVDLSRQYDDFILNLVRENMANYGYVLEPDPENNPPDVILTVAAMATKNYQVWHWYPYYWGWYPGWGWYYKSTDYYWYPGYPGWGGGTTVTSYTVGTTFMNMHDMTNNTLDTDTIPTIWLGIMNGLLGSSSADMKNRLDYNINEAFKQSPYLDTK